MVNQRDFLLNTDYEMDKIVFYRSGSALPGQEVVISHGLSFTPLIIVVCSFNSDFSSQMTNPFLQFTDDGIVQIQFAVSDGVIYLQSYRNEPSPNQRMYYRIYAFEPSNSTGTVPSTSDVAKEFIVNTDYNYCKLYQKGVANSDKTITHNLGYIPLVMAWSGGTEVWRAELDGDHVAVTSSTVKIKTSIPVHYRIYYDEA